MLQFIHFGKVCCIAFNIYSTRFCLTVENIIRFSFGDHITALTHLTFVSSYRALWKQWHISVAVSKCLHRSRKSHGKLRFAVLDDFQKGVLFVLISLSFSFWKALIWEYKMLVVWFLITAFFFIYCFHTLSTNSFTFVSCWHNTFFHLIYSLLFQD